jgi:hypothetical protein
MFYIVCALLETGEHVPGLSIPFRSQLSSKPKTAKNIEKTVQKSWKAGIFQLFPLLGRNSKCQ